ncbi:MAG TPA: GTPase HflX [Gammaproteobacteria bacterium]|nr:GTPase HflX [Gammaproteobacteria bacterium]
MFERPQKGERAVLVHLDLYADLNREDLQEFRELVTSAGAEPVAVITGSRNSPHPRYFIGTGKAEEVRACVERERADVVLFNHALTPVQERNLEQLFKCRVLDRTGLILDIFAQRARTHEGKLQVELAQLQHLSTRLVRGWTHLERQKGGIGLRGPGETQLETDRRLLGDRIRQLNKRLARVRRQREQGRRARKRAELPTVSLVGYTNAGKSTLFNALTEADVMAANQLFATLDPTLRRLELGGGQAVVLADTVGFIRHLPHDLVEAFRSTLQETRDADLLLHVVDAASEERAAQTEQVNQVLEEIGASERPQLLVCNKIDRLPDVTPRVERDSEGRPLRVWVSALTGAGLDRLRETIVELLDQGRVIRHLRLSAAEGRLRAQLYERGQILQESVDERGNWQIKVELPLSDWQILDKREDLTRHIIGIEQNPRLAVVGEAP